MRHGEMRYASAGSSCTKPSGVRMYSTVVYTSPLEVMRFYCAETGPVLDIRETSFPQARVVTIEKFTGRDDCKCKRSGPGRQMNQSDRKQRLSPKPSARSWA